MRIDRSCKICGSVFEAIKTTQFFCSRKCFKRDYYIRTKAITVKKKQNPSFPQKKCGFCLEISQLDFDPMTHPSLYTGWCCPFCGTHNKIVLQYQGKPGSRQSIIDIYLQSESNFPNNTLVQTHITEYKTYHIPIHNPAEGNDSILVLTCELMNILEIQKGNRKKIVFS